MAGKGIVTQKRYRNDIIVNCSVAPSLIPNFTPARCQGQMNWSSEVISFVVSFAAGSELFATIFIYRVQSNQPPPTVDIICIIISGHFHVVQRAER